MQGGQAGRGSQALGGAPRMLALVYYPIMLVAWDEPEGSERGRYWYGARAFTP